MAAFEFIAEIFGEAILEGVFVRIPIKIYEWITGKDTGINGYRTEYKKYIKFGVAKKFFLAWETDVEQLKYKLTEGLETVDEKLHVADFQFIDIDQRTIIQPPPSISFYAFHFLIQWLAQYKIITVGMVETARTVYTTYNDPDSENLIGQTDKGKKFFISLMDDYSRRQFLRINSDINTIEGYDVLILKGSLAQTGKHIKV